MKVTKQDIKMTKFGYTFTIPKGTPTTHQTALGPDPNYNFISNLSWIPLVNGCKQYGLIHDATYYGINIKPELLEDI